MCSSALRGELKCSITCTSRMASYVGWGGRSKSCATRTSASNCFCGGYPNARIDARGAIAGHFKRLHIAADSGAHFKDCAAGSHMTGELLHDSLTVAPGAIDTARRRSQFAVIVLAVVFAVVLGQFVVARNVAVADQPAVAAEARGQRVSSTIEIGDELKRRTATKVTGFHGYSSLSATAMLDHLRAGARPATSQGGRQ
jgi:hypothetical protein